MNEPARTISCETHSPDETLALGRRLGTVVRAGEVIGLIGPLGTGKTQLVKGIATGLDIAATAVNSPTFIIVNEYEGRLHLFHVDAYRLVGGHELAALGFDEMRQSGGVIVVEWADRVQDLMPLGTLWIEILPTAEASRRFEARAPASLLARFDRPAFAPLAG